MISPDHYNDQPEPEKTYVIDDAGYIGEHLFMSQHRNKKEMHPLRVYDDIAGCHVYGISGETIKTDAGPDKIV